MSDVLPYVIEEFEDFHEGTQTERTVVRVTGLETGRSGTMRKDAFEHIERGYADAGEPAPLQRACATVVFSAEKNAEHSAEHIWHVWINSINPWGDSSVSTPPPMLTHRKELYEWKAAVGELARLPGWLTRARIGALPTEHRQCSQSPVEPLPENRLICALGVDVRDCPILRSFYETWDDETKRPYSDADLTPEHADAVAAKICVWHIFTQAIEASRRGSGIDTSEGYMQDEGDRRFWSTTYANMTLPDEEVLS